MVLVECKIEHRHSVENVVHIRKIILEPALAHAMVKLVPDNETASSENKNRWKIHE
jgi:hypothetical protein